MFIVDDDAVPLNRRVFIVRATDPVGPVVVAPSTLIVYDGLQAARR